MTKKIEYTDEEYEEFENLVDLLNSPDQMDRINGRMDMSKFVKKHGKQKCDAMYGDME